MRVRHPLRLVAITGISVVLAALAGLHTLSYTKFVVDPQTAIGLNPSNGPARAHLAFDRFYRAVQSWSPTNTSDPQSVVAEAMAAVSSAAEGEAEAARLAYKLEPLSPKAHTILALSAPDEETKNEIIDVSSRLNKRELVLQSLVFEKYIAEGSYSGVIETLDQTLRAHPEVSDRYFPSLVEALTIDVALPQFVDLFANPLPWRQQFLNFALRDDRALQNLTVLRGRVILDDQNFDKRLIARLAEQGDLQSARAVHRIVRPSVVVGPTSGRLDWHSDYPPFEWRLASERGFRADIADNGVGVVLDVAPGRGGVLASRLVFPSGSRLLIRVDHSMNLERRRDQIRIKLVCLSSNDVVLDRQIINRTENFSTDLPTSTCNAYTLEVGARVWSDSETLQGTISAITLSS